MELPPVRPPLLLPHPLLVLPHPHLPVSHSAQAGATPLNLYRHTYSDLSLKDQLLHQVLYPLLLLPLSLPRQTLPLFLQPHTLPPLLELCTPYPTLKLQLIPPSLLFLVAGYQPLPHPLLPRQLNPVEHVLAIAVDLFLQDSVVERLPTVRLVHVPLGIQSRS